jgi:hypothetical protein
VSRNRKKQTESEGKNKERLTHILLHKRTAFPAATVLIITEDRRFSSLPCS